MFRTRMIAFLCLIVVTPLVRGDDWPQWMGPDRDGRWAEKGIIDTFPAGGPKVLWRTKIAGGYAGPAVADGKVYVTDFVTAADIRKLSEPNRPMNPVKGKERVLCLDAKTGKEIWNHTYDVESTVSYPAGPRCTPTVADGKVYTLGAEGHLVCLDAKKGTVIWKKHFPTDYKIETPVWGFTGHPLVDGKKLICLVGGKGSVAVTFDKDSGKELWKALDAKEPGYCPPSMITAAGKRQLIIWDSEKINSLNPETGTLYWSERLKPNYGMSIMAPRKLGNYLFAGGIGFHAVCLELATDKPGAKVVWRGKNDTGIYPVNSTPILDEGTIFGVDQPGTLRAVDLQSGKRLWETNKPITGEKPASSGTAFLVKNGERYFLFNEKGELVIAKLSRKEYEEIGRAKILEPTGYAFRRDVVWTHPAFANKCMFARNDKEIVCVSLAK